MSRRPPTILFGMVLGLVWGVALVWIGAVHVNLPIFSYTWSLALAFLIPGLVLALMIGRLALRRFLDDAPIDGDPFPPGSGARIDNRVMRDTVEQLVLALTVWPATGHILAEDGPGVVVCLGIGFALARLAFWAGSHLSPPLRAFGFAATFYPTLIALVWAVLYWVL